MRNIDIAQLRSILEEWENYSLTLEDIEKIVAFKNEIWKYLQTFRLSLMVDKVDERWENEKVLGNQIDILTIIMKDLQEQVEDRCVKAQDSLSKKKSKKVE